jgi:hypothetical protein
MLMVVGLRGDFSRDDLFVSVWAFEIDDGRLLVGSIND